MARPSIDVTVLCDSDDPEVQGHGVASLWYVNDGATTAEAAQAHTVITDYSHRTQFATVKALNPDARILLYMSPFQTATGVMAEVPEASLRTPVGYARAQAHDTAFPGDKWVLEDGSGNDINGGGASPNYLLDVSKTSLRTEILTNLRNIYTAFIANGWPIDGFFYDNVNGNYRALATASTPLYSFTPTNNTPEWWAETVEFASVVFAAQISDGRYLLPNVGVSPTNFYEDAIGSKNYQTDMAPYLSGIHMEWWLESVQETLSAPCTQTEHYPWVNEKADCPFGHWNSWSAAPTHAASLGKDFFAGHYGSQSHGGGNLADDQQRMLYIKGSMLLTWVGGDGGLWMVQHARNVSTPDMYDPRWTRDVGTPDGAKFAVGNGWQRYYTGGPNDQRAVVIVNPHPTSSQVFTFDATYTSLHDGAPYSGFTLPANRALILYR
jgi:hypothetical protein